MTTGPQEAAVAARQIDQPAFITVLDELAAQHDAPGGRQLGVVVVAIDGRSPRALWVPRGTVHVAEDTGSASRVYVFELK